jgi:hypothetical protein
MLFLFYAILFLFYAILFAFPRFLSVSYSLEAYNKLKFCLKPNLTTPSSRLKHGVSP